MSKNLDKLVVAGVIYAGFAIYLYQPHFRHFDGLDYLLPVNLCLAASGCYVLSRRWVAGFAGSFFAGAVYGFGPFILGLAKFHPTTGFLTATIPWLFFPAVFGPKFKWRWLRVPLSCLPFFAILLFFQTSARFHLFAIPVRTKLNLVDLAGLLVPLVAVKQNLTLVGFYHIPTAALIIGFFMLFAARRFGVMVIFSLGLILSFCNSLFNISPVIWLVIPVLCCSVLIGAGVQGLISSGFADRKWVLVTTVIMTVCSVVTLLAAAKYAESFAGLGTGYAKLFTETAKIYLLGAIATGIIFFMARAKSHIHWLRLSILCSAMVVDIFLGARFIVDKIV
ncbi:MAG: hypothetical protein ACYS9Y_15095 [Planctomycetota bacterium]|jgi:hypothetical protein